MKKGIIITGVVILGFMAAFGAASVKNLPAQAVVVAPQGTWEVFVADTPEKRTQGLSGTDSLPKDTGLLFLFEEPGRPVFWMKDMNYPLDIVWMKSDGEGRYRVVTIAENVLPETYPATFSPDGDSDAVLEINAFEARAYGLEKGVDISTNNVRSVE